MNIYISASELAILTGHNTYKTKHELYVKYWKKYWPEDFKNILQKVKLSNKKCKLPETPSECMTRIARENNIDKKKINEIFNASKEKNTQKMNFKKKGALDSMLKQIPKEQRQELTKSVNSVAFTNFGTRNENDGVKVFESITSNNVELTNKYYNEELFIIEDLNRTDIWSIRGKIDGIFTDKNNNNRVILEIKNRVRGLFKLLRDYEKVQCYAYMFILGLNCVQLAECFKSEDNIEMNIIEINWDQEFWNNQIQDRLSIFIDDFYDFLKDEKRKILSISSN